MKIRETRTVDSTFGEDFETQAFTIAVNAKSFHVLLDSLYTNKPRSIVRELWTNAYDAHVAAGCEDAPFHCQLPTPLDPVFSVRDYGIAMTPDETVHLYTTVFSSSKNDGPDADKYVGALGLGSKSPFSYTDAFTVTVWRDGEKRVYLAAIGNDGIPTLTHLSTVESEDPRGVEVSFPVQAQDFHRFRAEAEIVAEGFEVKPTVPGLALDVAPALFEGESWKVMNRTTNAIRQGCVIYPVHDFNLETKLSYRHGLIVNVPIGTVDVAANREALSLDDRTIANVNDAFGAAVKELEAQVTEYILSAPDLFEANVRYNTINEFFMIEDTGLTYHGQTLNGVIEFQRSEFKTTPQHIANEKEKQITTARIKFAVESAGRLRFLVDRTGNDVPRKRTRFRTWKKNLRAHERDYLFVLKDPTSKQLAALVRRLHLRADQIIGIGSLPDVVIERAPRSPRGTGTIPGVYDLTSYADIAITTVAEDYLYVEIPRIDAREWYGFDEITGGSYYSSNRQTVKGALLDAYRLIEDPRPIYALTPGAVKRLNPRKSQQLLPAVKAWVQANKKEAAHRVKVTTAKQRIRSSARSTRYTSLSNELVDELLIKLDPNASAVDSSGSLITMFARLDQAAYLAAEEAGNKFAEKIEQRYPLLFAASEADILRYVRSNPRKPKSTKEGQ